MVIIKLETFLVLVLNCVGLFDVPHGLVAGPGVQECGYLPLLLVIVVRCGRLGGDEC